MTSRIAFALPLLTLLACGGATPPAETTPEPAATASEPAAPSALLSKAPAELTKEDFSGALSELGYELKSFSVSGRFTTVLGKQGDERLTIHVLQVTPEQVASETERLSNKQGAAKVSGEHVLGVSFDPADSDKAKTILAVLFGE